MWLDVLCFWGLHWSSWFRWPFPWLLFSPYLFWLFQPFVLVEEPSVRVFRVLQHSQFYSCIPHVKCCWDPNILQGQTQSSCWLLLKKWSCNVLFPLVRFIPPSLWNQFLRLNILIRKVYEDAFLSFTLVKLVPLTLSLIIILAACFGCSNPLFWWKSHLSESFSSFTTLPVLFLYTPC